MNPREQLLDELARVFARVAVDAFLRELDEGSPTGDCKVESSDFSTPANDADRKQAGE